jgi:hypothetical protein
MRIELDQAIKIYAKACRSWYRGKAQNVALKRARELYARGDHQGFVVWQQLAMELKRQAEQAERPR